MTRLGEKGLMAIRIAEARYHTPQGKELYEEACQRFSEKALLTKLQELADRGYIEYGVSVRTAWLTDKGKAACEGKEQP